MTRRLPISPSPGPLEEYAARFDDLFRARAQREGFRRYLEGLLLPAERNKTLTALANTEPSTGAQHKEAQSLQWFLSESGWDAEAVNRRRLEILLQSAETAPHASGVLIIDVTGARKDGKKTAHVGKRYLGGIGKIENGVVSVSSLWADERLYYPPANGRALHPGAPFRAGEGRTRFPPQAQDSARTGEGRARSRDAERATSRIATGRSSATTYHLSPTRQRTMLASRSRTPAHPRVKASTTMAEMMGLQGSIGTLSGLAKTNGQSHHASTNARTKNTTRSWRFTQFMLLLPPRRDHDAMYVGPAHLAAKHAARATAGREGPPEAVTIAPEEAHLTDEQWALVCPLLPPQMGGIGRPPNDHRLVLGGILWVARTGSSWREMPEEYGKWESAYRRHQLWAKRGLWQRILQALGEEDVRGPATKKHN